MKIIHVVGARPNFMKVAPVMRALARLETLSQVLVHTGQHYDANMSQVFFDQLALVEPTIALGVGSGTHAQQTAAIMVRFEEVVVEQRPDLVLVYGDVNSTVAAALVCAKLGISVGHVEAGLRSFDRTMPEEVNRLLTDRISDLLFTPSEDGNENLRLEGTPPEKVHFVGNVMIDTLVFLRPKASQLGSALRHSMGLREYGLVTLHRPSNVDEVEVLGRIISTLNEIAGRLPLLFPVHPRARQRMQSGGILPLASNLRLIDPLGYLEFLALQEHAAVVLTDSGGIQEETTFLGVPCITLRANTERPVTVSIGTNVLVGQDMGLLRLELERVLDGRFKRGEIPPLWDGKAAERIAECIEKARGHA